MGKHRNVCKAAAMAILVSVCIAILTFQADWSFWYKRCAMGSALKPNVLMDSSFNYLFHSTYCKTLNCI